MEQVKDVKFHLDPATRSLRLLGPTRQLIITSGATNDVDGFLALAEYSKVPIVVRVVRCDQV